MAYKVYPYKQGSRSAKLLADTLGGRVLKLQGSTYRPRVGDVIINWGAGHTPYPYAPYDNVPILNLDTHIASNKLSAFEVMSAENVAVPEFWRNADEIPNEAFPVMARTILRGHSGAGIVYCPNRDDVVAAPLYTRYVKKAEEYRVHVYNGRVFLCQRKARKIGTDADYKVRNLANGFVFLVCDEDEVPQDAKEQSIMAVAALGLDFGAVDIIWNRHYNRSYVLEVNCAPGLEQRTADAYATAFRGE